MRDLRFHVSGARFRSFPRRFPAYERKRCFVSFSFPTGFLRTPFVSCFLPVYGQRETTLFFF
jgi:hypothetical protein